MNKSQLQQIIREEVRSILGKESVNEVKKDKHGNHLEPQFKKGDKVTYLGNKGVITGVNKEPSGVYSYNVSYDKGSGKVKARNIFNKSGDEIKEPINEDFGTIALGVAGGLLLLKVLKFVAKQVIGGVARNAPLGKEPLYTTIDAMTKELIKQKSKDPNGKLKDVSLVDIVKLKEVLKKLVDKGQIKTMKDIEKIIKKGSQGGINESINEL